MRQRIIGRIDIKNEFVIKGINFEGLRKIGDPIKIAKKFYEYKLDEIFIYDAVASLYGRNSLFDLIKKITKEIFIPVCLSGGIRTLKDIEKALSSGADKVGLNSAIVKNPKLLKKASKVFGLSNIVSTIEAKKKTDTFWEIYINNGRDETGINLIDWIDKVQEFGCGEIILSSIDRDGTMKGFDWELIEFVDKNASMIVPFIFSGGCSNFKDILKLNKKYKNTSCAIASALHYNKINKNRLLSL
tara:strand:- start:6185 stop:6916 length:732 start_codon:yes stop_codon:yes gene_type:complete